MKLKTEDIQQLSPGFRIVEVISAPLTVRVHEALDVSLANNRNRYFISVDLRFRIADALNIGTPGYLGCTKAEAVLEARALAAKIVIVHTGLEAAKQQAERWDTRTNRWTVDLQSRAFDKLVSRYCALLEPGETTT